MIKRVLIVLAMCCALGAVAETPKEGAAAILSLLKEKKYDVLFPKRYSEWHKVEAAGMEPAKAIEKLSAMWEKNHAMMVGLFEQLAKAEYKMSKSEHPQKTETGDMATAEIEVKGRKIPYRLYKMKNGLWGFHM